MEKQYPLLKQPVIPYYVFCTETIATLIVLLLSVCIGVALVEILVHLSHCTSDLSPGTDMYFLLLYCDGPYSVRVFAHYASSIHKKESSIQ